MPESTANDRFEIHFEMSSGKTWTFTVNGPEFDIIVSSVKHVRGGCHTFPISSNQNLTIFYEHVVSFLWEKVDDSGESVEEVFSVVTPKKRD